MKKLITAFVLATSLTSAANAVVSGTFSTVDPGGPIDYAFDDLAGSPLLSISGGTIRNGTAPGTAVAPAGGTGKYFSVDPAFTPGVITFTTGATALSFVWGSPDPYNSLLVTLTNGNAYAVSPFSTSGLNSDSRWLSLSVDPGEAIKSLTLVSNEYAFEIDSLRFTSLPVPEPTTWAMMVAGLALAGATMRRRKTAVSFA